MGKIKVAVIGVGSMGKNHARVFAELDECNLVAICDIDEAQAKKIAEKLDCHAYTNYKEMFSKENLDLVSIAVPTSLHREVALDAIDTGLHLIVEKPISDSIEHAKEIVNKAKEKGLTLSVGHIERFNPAVIKLKEIIDNGKLGEIVNISTKRVGLVPPRVKDANIVVDVAVHDIEIINHLLGKYPDKIFTHGGKALSDEREDFVEILMVYNKASGVVQCNWMTPIKIRTLSITGTKGYAELDYIQQSLVLHKKNYNTSLENFEENVKFSPSETEIISIKKEEPLKLELMNMIKSVNGVDTPTVTGKHAVDSLQVSIEVNNMLKKVE